jgi:hypothetical protein
LLSVPAAHQKDATGDTSRVCMVMSCFRTRLRMGFGQGLEQFS